MSMQLFKTATTALLAITLSMLTACATTQKIVKSTASTVSNNNTGQVTQNSSSITRHLKSAALSAAAYNQNPKTRLALLSEQGLTEVKYVGLKETAATGSATQYIIAEQDKTLYISFTGSNEKKDFLSLLSQYETYQTSSYPVRNGFVQAWEEAETGITALIRQKNPISIVISGHSKGGAIASAAALKLMAEGFPVTEVTTFGAPPIFKIPTDETDTRFKDRLSSSALTTRLDKISTHYVRQSDYVQLASAGMSMNNRSIGTLLSLKDDGTTQPGSSLMSSALGAVTNATKIEKFDSSALNHNANTYLEILKKAK
jgi:hypothetical protein